MRRRPTFINLFLIKLPISAMSSITHRATGIVNFFVTIPTFVLLFLTNYLLNDDNLWDINKFSFEVKILISVSLISFTYHILAGIRHLLIDFTDFGHEIDEARSSAIFVFGLTLIISIFLIMEAW
ncbi:MAG: succinate dehydrogenase, cytochrome b556 subunit [Gammaproteobacteria bacterium]|uniref:Succinate dehydrogenase cytochrome b556 subunit n=1 Tax=SAR86 cluster bacterium TaxID=2030880 RepID=A0A520N1C2_9GAMM|nr:succinate dehydrogenase, cytochrome b556 subunit [Gammaproteobacteria bacterium]MBA4729521.1 succinate dehydrogenase, cytochrome b556 subunit [SAR86 cluster bacterium]RPG34853.1 MAG: succinate dehydrogenase, cytochrome b556 subunit [Gammaproteobacteria bacterium TMED193]RZO27280.1 MAG: succinate dehydrogenase, cytochrome b556 subunit [SAR86 cluster bacterium]|tara:strand:- start:28920 stop:29294 length:375 start_codon:yes stop_codon:yes gene_type:complete